MDTERKNIDLQTINGDYAMSQIGAAWPNPMTADRYRQDLASPDYPYSVSSRLVWTHHNGMADNWVDGNMTPGGGGLGDMTTWRTVKLARFELGPGQRPALKIIGIECGSTETGVGGNVRLVCALKNAAGNTSAVTTEYLNLPISTETNALEKTGNGEAWTQVYCAIMDGAFTPIDWSNPSERSKWGEWPTITYQLQVRGQPRIIHASAWEVPFIHTVDHTVETSSLADWSSGDVPFQQPQIEQADGATYEEHRFGTLRGLNAAFRQSQRWGPHIASWSAYDDDTVNVGNTAPTPVQVTSTTPVGLSVGSVWEYWDANAPGYQVHANPNGRIPENLHTRVRVAAGETGEQYIASIPVRCRVYARFTTNAGSKTGRITFQSSDRSWVHVDVPESSSWGWYSQTGWLEASSSSRDWYINLMDFASVDGATMEILYWCVEYGDYEAGED